MVQTAPARKGGAKKAAGKRQTSGAKKTGAKRTGKRKGAAKRELIDTGTDKGDIRASSRARVFIASPGDVAHERLILRKTINAFEVRVHDRKVSFQASGWEDLSFFFGLRIQASINHLIDECDIFVLILHRRWGEETSGLGLYSSHTEEELHRALASNRKRGVPQVCFFLKQADGDHDDPADVQYLRVKRFVQQVQDSEMLMIHRFQDDSELTEITRRVLDTTIQGLHSPALDTQRRTFVPTRVVAVLESEIRRRQLAEAREHQLAALLVDGVKPRENVGTETEPFALAEHMASDRIAEVAARLGDQGATEGADALFDELAGVTTSPAILDHAAKFWLDTHDFRKAAKAIRRAARVAKVTRNPAGEAVALSNRARLEFGQGRFEEAKASNARALEIWRTVGDDVSVARQHTSYALALWAGRRDETSDALKALEEAIAVFRSRDLTFDLATALSTRGLVQYRRDHVHDALGSHLEALQLYERLGCLREASNERLSMGDIYRSDPFIYWDAENLYLQAEAEKKRLRDRRGVALSARKLGQLYEKMWLIAGGPHAFDLAGSKYSEAIELESEIDDSLLLPRNFESLGTLLGYAGTETSQAHQALSMALRLFKRLGDKEASARVRKKMDELAEHRGLPLPEFSKEQRRDALLRIRAIVGAAREEDIGRRVSAASARKGKRARRR